MSECGVTFIGEFNGITLDLAEVVAEGLRLKFNPRWESRLAANLAMAALLGAAARQAWIAAGGCEHHIGNRCHCDNDE